MPEISYLEAIRQALWQEMKRDERVFLLGEDIGRYGGAFGLTHGMLEEFGEERVLETPISEATIVAKAIGAALLGNKVIYLGLVRACQPVKFGLLLLIKGKHALLFGTISIKRSLLLLLLLK